MVADSHSRMGSQITVEELAWPIWPIQSLIVKRLEQTVLLRTMCLILCMAFNEASDTSRHYKTHSKCEQPKPLPTGISEHNFNELMDAPKAE